MGFSGAFAGLWLSHVPVQRLREFFASLHGSLSAGARVVLIDNSKAQCERLPISYTDEQGNTYQGRVLDDGSLHRVLKNFPDRQQLDEAISGWGANAEFLQLENFWLYTYTLTRVR